MPRRRSPLPDLGQLLASALTAVCCTAVAIGHLGYAAAAGAAPPKSAPPTEPPERTGSYAIEDHEEGAEFSDEQLEQLVGPIALYPDDLLAVVLPAATYPLQIVQASRFLEKKATNDALEPDEGWDSSVLGVLNYPEVLDLMNDDLNWTWQLGEAVANQQPAVMDAVQRFRGKAKAAGNLEDNDKMVIQEREEEGQQVIFIESASPDVIYVPVYQPSNVIVYYAYPYPYPWYWTHPYPYYWHSHATFWTGMFIGTAVAYHVGWHHYGHSSIHVNHNVNVNRNVKVDRHRNIKRNRGGEKWSADRNRGRHSGARPGNRDRAGDRKGAGTRSSKGARDRAGDRRGTGTRSSTGARDRKGDRTGTGTGTRPPAGTRDRAGSDGETRPKSRNGERAGGAERSRDDASKRSRGSRASQRSSRSNGSFGRYDDRGSSRSHSSRGSTSRDRSGMGGGRRGGGGRSGGGGHGRGGGRRR